MKFTQMRERLRLNTCEKRLQNYYRRVYGCEYRYAAGKAHMNIGLEPVASGYYPPRDGGCAEHAMLRHGCRVKNPVTLQPADAGGDRNHVPTYWQRCNEQYDADYQFLGRRNGKGHAAGSASASSSHRTLYGDMQQSL